MAENYRDDLDKILKYVSDELENMEIGTEEHARVVKEYADLHELRQKLETIDNDRYDKYERRQIDIEKYEADLAMREKELDVMIANSRKANKVQIASTIITSGVMAGTFLGNILIERAGNLGSNPPQLWRIMKK